VYAMVTTSPGVPQSACMYCEANWPQPVGRRSQPTTCGLWRHSRRGAATGPAAVGVTGGPDRRLAVGARAAPARKAQSVPGRVAPRPRTQQVGVRCPSSACRQRRRSPRTRSEGLVETVSSSDTVTHKLVIVPGGSGL